MSKGSKMLCRTTKKLVIKLSNLTNLKKTTLVGSSTIIQKLVNSLHKEGGKVGHRDSK